MRHWLLTLTVFLAMACSYKNSEAESSSKIKPSGHTRIAKYAGSWYPETAAELNSILEQYLAEVSLSFSSSTLVAAIVPHAGLRFSGKVAAHVYAHIRQHPPKRIFILGPSHRAAFNGIALPASDLQAYATPLGDLQIDQTAVELLRKHHEFNGPNNVHESEHSIEMQTIFIAKVAPGVKIIPLVVGTIGSIENSQNISATIKQLLQPDDLVIVSSDFTHYGNNYGFLPFTSDIPKQLQNLADKATIALSTPNADAFTKHIKTTHDTICGREAILILLGLLPQNIHSKRLAFDTSGHMLGDYTNSVSYLAYAYSLPSGWPSASKLAHNDSSDNILDIKQQQLALAIARKTLSLVLAHENPPSATILGVPDDAVWHQKYGTFVTLTKTGKLRGCIGHIMPILPLWQDIRDNAISAALDDPRFNSVTLNELSDLDIEISILSSPQKIAQPLDFKIGKHGIILNYLGRRAVFLPQVAPEQGWDQLTTLQYLSLKAGLSNDAWQSPQASFEVFTAQVFSEKHLKQMSH
ncbi:MAG: AmmeMemoRadiSam system protein B [Deltaproteobacteria bacterium]|nr:AmmeMemoRadiSam system protein B [Deltaproteobacteria bacterium]